MKAHILVVDDEPTILKALNIYLEGQGFEVSICDDFLKAKEKLAEGFINLALIDLRLAGENGLELVRWIREKALKIPSIIMTGHGSIETAIEAIKEGAFHYLTKPFELADLHNLMEKALEHARMTQENRLLKKQLASKYEHQPIIGDSDKMKEVFKLVHRVAKTDSTVLVLGNSGTGKELVAHSIHYQSVRRTGPIIAVNCAALPENLLESELFGHVKGAFTGALKNRMGRFEQAHKGTLFLDEIGEMSPNIQVKLLRVLQEKKFEPVGSNRRVEVDVRIIAATNRNLELAVEKGIFREDLYYRLNVIPLYIPPLSERQEDIPLLVEYFLKRFSKRHGVPLPQLNAEAWQVLKVYPWPGNVRELENLIERLMILFPGQEVPIDALPICESTSSQGRSFKLQIPEEGVSLKSLVSNFENELILKALEKTSGNKNKAATLLRLNRTTLVEKIKKRQLEARN